MTGDLWQTVSGAFLSAIEREWLKYTAQSVAEVFDAPLLVNIGVWKGASMHCLRAGAPDATLVGIDVNTHKTQGVESLRAELIRRDSRHMGSWSRPIHLLFIDGGHAYEVVRSDIRTFGKHVVVGGITAFHDYNRSKTYLEKIARRRPGRLPLGVRRAVDELCTKSRGWDFLAMIDSIKAFQRAEA